MKLSVLDLTQNILSSLDSDEVNSIGDTVESRQVAEIIRTSYFNIITRANLPEHKQLFQLVASTDNTLPVLMTRPDTVRKIEWIKYNSPDTDDLTNDNYKYVTILPVQQFTDMVNGFSSDETNVESLIFNEMNIKYKNDRDPCYCTVLQDYYVLFDSYNVNVEDTLQSSKTMVFGQLVPVFTLSDTFIPELEDYQFPLLLNEAKSLASMELKQVANDKAERETRRQWISLQKNKQLDKISYFDQLPNFGRK